MRRIHLTACCRRLLLSHICDSWCTHTKAIQDHFGLILNEPAGKIAQRIVEYSVNLIVQVGIAACGLEIY